MSDPNTSQNSKKTRGELITQNLEEVITPEDLAQLLADNGQINHYIGFEISGKVHLGTGILAMQKVRDFAKAGIKTHIWLADWHAWINDKLGGDRAVIKKMATGYFQEALTAGYIAVGGNPADLNFRLASDFYHDHTDDFWATVIEVSKNTSLSRMQRSIDILGRVEGENVDFAKLIYPAMQVADIFTQDFHLAHAGMDQRKAHVIARDVANQLTIHPLRNAKGEVIKPIGLHHHLLLGLGKPKVWPVAQDKLRELWADFKMSKSKPETAIFISDSPEEIRRKIMAAFCPPDEIKLNPLLDWLKYIILSDEGSVFTVEREEVHGGNKLYHDFETLAADYLSGKLHPQDLKASLAEAIIKLLQPAQAYLADPSRSQMVSEMDQMTITR